MAVHPLLGRRAPRLSSTSVSTGLCSSHIEMVGYPHAPPTRSHICSLRIQHQRYAPINAYAECASCRSNSSYSFFASSSPRLLRRHPRTTSCRDPSKHRASRSRPRGRTLSSCPSPTIEARGRLQVQTPEDPWRIYWRQYLYFPDHRKHPQWRCARRRNSVRA